MMERESRLIPLDELAVADWNANRVSAGGLAKIERSITEFGLIENLVARPHPALAGMFELLSGNHRLRILRRLGHETAPVVVVELDDARARLLAQTMNRTRGSDDPQAYARLLDEVLASIPLSEATALLPETEATIDRILCELGSKNGAAGSETVPAVTSSEEPRSRPGEIYELGTHRVACGDATDPGLVAELLQGDQLALALKRIYVFRLANGNTG